LTYELKLHQQNVSAYLSNSQSALKQLKPEKIMFQNFDKPNTGHFYTLRTLMTHWHSNIIPSYHIKMTAFPLTNTSQDDSSHNKFR